MLIIMLPFKQTSQNVVERNFKDTRRKTTPSNKTKALTKSMNIMCIWVIGT